MRLGLPLIEVKDEIQRFLAEQKEMHKPKIPDPYPVYSSHLIDETREQIYPELKSWRITHAVHHLPRDLLHLSRAIKVQDGCPWAGRRRALECETCVFRVGGDGREWQGMMKDGQGQ